MCAVFYSPQNARFPSPESEVERNAVQWLPPIARATVEVLKVIGEAQIGSCVTIPH
jgi:hypothetical protein